MASSAAWTRPSPLARSLNWSAEDPHFGEKQVWVQKCQASSSMVNGYVYLNWYAFGMNFIDESVIKSEFWNSYGDGREVFWVLLWDWKPDTICEIREAFI